MQAASEVLVSSLPRVPEAAGGQKTITSISLVSYGEPAPISPADSESQHITTVSRASTQFRFPFLATPPPHTAPRQSGLCLPLGTGLAHVLPPIPWKPWLLLVLNTLLDRVWAVGAGRRDEQGGGEGEREARWRQTYMSLSV